MKVGDTATYDLWGADGSHNVNDFTVESIHEEGDIVTIEGSKLVHSRFIKKEKALKGDFSPERENCRVQYNRKDPVLSARVRLNLEAAEKARAEEKRKSAQDSARTKEE